MTVGFIRGYAVLFSLSLVAVISEAAVDEQVSIGKVVGNKAVLARGDRDFYLVETRPACPSLALQEGRTVLARSSDGFLSSQSGLVLGNQEQPCRIARAVALFSNAASSALDDAPGTGSLAIEKPQALLALQEALMLLGHDPGTVGSKAQTMKVVNEIRRQYGNEPTPEGLKKTVVLMALQVISRNPNDDRAKGVSRKLLNLALGSGFIENPTLKNCPANLQAWVRQQTLAEQQWLAATGAALPLVCSRSSPAAAVRFVSLGIS